MADSVTIGMMDEGLLAWRCLHGGPLTARSIEDLPAGDGMPWAELRARNVPLLTGLTQAYGSCAVLARDGEVVVGTLRFYPKALCRSPRFEAYGMCLQQQPPNGPPEEISGAALPPPAELPDRTLFVHCLMVAPDAAGRASYRRRGIARRMAGHLVGWARASGWTAVEAMAYEDLEIVYAITGVAGRGFWEGLGFSIAAAGTEPALDRYPDLLKAFTEQARARGLSAEAARTRYTMRLAL
jgi:GNAT superfamily N-acetyltransferase